ncbi:MAG: SDR family NAD(P)-dependent oxidoreductase, partial [Planctomycetota bacterium]
MSAEFLQQLFSLDGQVAVVIGGTGVLGGAFCDGLAGAGAHVVVSGRSEERGGQRVGAIVAAGGAASFKSVDGTNRQSIIALRDAIVADHGRVDVLVNCAGVNAATPYEEISDEDWHRILDG